MLNVNAEPFYIQPEANQKARSSSNLNSSLDPIYRQEDHLQLPTSASYQFSNASSAYQTATPNSPAVVAVKKTRGGTIIFVSNCKGNIFGLEQLALQYTASTVVHIGNFGLYDRGTISNIDEDIVKKNLPEGKECLYYQDIEFLITQKKRLSINLYVVPGDLDDPALVEKLKLQPELIPNLHLITTSCCLELEQVKFKFFKFCKFDLINDFDGCKSYLEKLFEESDSSVEKCEVKIFCSSYTAISDADDQLLYKLAYNLQMDYLLQVSSTNFLGYQPILAMDNQDEVYKIFSANATENNGVVSRFLSFYEEQHVKAPPQNFNFKLPLYEEGHVVLNVNTTRVSHIIVNGGLNLAGKFAQQVGRAFNLLKIIDEEVNQISEDNRSPNNKSNGAANNPWKQKFHAHSQENKLTSLNENSEVVPRPRPKNDRNLPSRPVSWSSWDNIAENAIVYQSRPLSGSSWETATDSSGFDSENGITIWVGNLPEVVNETDIRNFFRNIPILRIKMTTNRPDKRPCAFVDVADTDALEAALRLGGERLHGVRLKVEYDPSRLKKEFGFKGRANSYPSLSAVAQGKLPAEQDHQTQQQQQLQQLPRLTKSKSSDWIGLQSQKNHTTETLQQQAINNNWSNFSNNEFNNNMNLDALGKSSSWDSPPRKEVQSFSSGKNWDLPFNNKVNSIIPGMGWEDKSSNNNLNLQNQSQNNHPWITKSKSSLNLSWTTDGSPLKSPIINSTPGFGYGTVSSPSNNSLGLEWNKPSVQQSLRSPTSTSVQSFWNSNDVGNQNLMNNNYNQEKLKQQSKVWKNDKLGVRPGLNIITDFGNKSHDGSPLSAPIL
ncbi:hypothetical protein HDU92_005144, partial [Lobulomyces angularis]